MWVDPEKWLIFQYAPVKKNEIEFQVMKLFLGFQFWK